jgi:RND superfamily putative drug exporter
VLGALLGLKNSYGGEYVNNYTVSGSGSTTGLDMLNKRFAQQGGYGGHIVFHAPKGSTSRPSTSPSATCPSCRIYRTS